MKHDSSQLSSVNTRSFQDSQEWKIYKHVECTHQITTLEYASSTIHPILVFSCRVRRKVWYFIWNIVFIVVSLTGYRCSERRWDLGRPVSLGCLQ